MSLKDINSPVYRKQISDIKKKINSYDLTLIEIVNVFHDKGYKMDCPRLCRYLNFKGFRASRVTLERFHECVDIAVKQIKK